MPSISHAVEWGLKCCAAPNSDDPDFQGWYGLYEAVVATRNMTWGSPHGGYYGYIFDCESFVNIALCLGGRWPQYDEVMDMYGYVPGGHCYQGNGWGDWDGQSIHNSIAGDNAEEWLIAMGFSEITDRDTTLLPGDVLLVWYTTSDANPGHAEMVWQEGGSPNAGGWHMGAHGQYSNGVDDVSANGQYWSYVNRYNLNPACRDLKWFRYQYEDDDSTPLPGPGTGGNPTGSGSKSDHKHRAWLYLRNPRLYNLRR